VQYDVAIIGAGMSGLGAGIRLALYGRKVCILERHSLWGGLNSFYRLGGHRFDVGLHAMTNFVPRGTRNAPLTKLLRQLRIDYDAFELRPQIRSTIAFPGLSLHFTNQFGLFEQEVCQAFPRQADGFRRLVEHIRQYDALDLEVPEFSARETIARFLDDPLLVDMLLCPLFFYGSAVENDMDFGQFVIMFKSLFFEGFARPWAGVRRILDVLVERFKALGGELRLRAGVAAIEVDEGRVRGLRLDDGSTLEAAVVLSSAGAPETAALLPGGAGFEDEPAAGSLSFVEAIEVLDRPMSELGHDETIVFYSATERFRYERPALPVDLASGVICCPDNFQFDRPLETPMIRITNLADHAAWAGLPEEAYRAAKEHWHQAVLEQAVKLVPDFRFHVRFTDMFTPTTVTRFTGHLNGAVYGSPRKLKNGRTRLSNLFLMGTDQGMLGIVGALLSGISMANMHVLQE
jgi:phytoene dehydrogenase-like protein